MNSPKNIEITDKTGMTLKQNSLRKLYMYFENEKTQNTEFNMHTPWDRDESFILYSNRVEIHCVLCARLDKIPKIIIKRSSILQSRVTVAPGPTTSL